MIPTAPDSSGSRAVMLTMPLRWQPGEMLRALDVFPRERESQRGWIHSNAAFFFCQEILMCARVTSAW